MQFFNNRANKGFVYIFQTRSEGEQGYFKVGSTASDPRKRLAQVQTGCPVKLDLATCFYFDDGTYQQKEKLLHKLLEKNRVNGEWFLTTIDIGEVYNEFAKKFADNEVIKIHEFGVYTVGIKKLGDAVEEETRKQEQIENKELERDYHEYLNEKEVNHG